ncbi:hypothetical protein [Streptomyces sp. ADI93-02]|uniref:hypothetical protein n=1 Tax=Streptomyces sp. ADI93-02 TaxID=1522757 RepID=UPI000FA5C416|nr:hypothetical protein [Streptomyces sp. ADI93-02]RPK40875.1 hypothetical protein EES40_21665 [Streptomyces sp. ADI93-02]
MTLRKAVPARAKDAPPGKKRTREAKKPPPYLYGPIPDDTFGTKDDPRDPHGPQAPNLIPTVRFDYLVNNPDLYTAAATLPGPSPVGRRPHFPPVVYLIYLCSISVFGSARSTASHFQHEDWWEPVRSAIRTHLGDEAADGLKPTGPTRSNWNHYFRRYLKPAHDKIREISSDLWIEQALAHGMLCDNDKRTSRVRPARHQVLHGDATVAKPPSGHSEHETVDERTGEIRRHRVDEDAGVTVEGGGKLVYGNKFLSTAVRLANTPHSRVILALEAIRHKSLEEDPERESEGVALVEMVKHILTRVPSTKAVTYDAALRGRHRAPLIAKGLVVFTPQHEGVTPQSLLRHKDGTCAHDLYVAEARVCERHITVDGKTHYTPLPVEELEQRKGEKARFYHRITINCPVKTHTLRIRCDETDEDRQIDPKTKRQRFNRTEHLRQVPPSTPAGRRLKGFRQDSESIHSRFDQSYPHKRVPAYGARGALLIYLGYAWVNNSITRSLNAISS